ncbi:VCBS repeat-containing protein [[Phormidium] sp. ETS-05]|uniref:FG-GAP repeat domain-containing protein n=1 Tax=[Phormidium] sp. ETS-05 TaxID=222819 RepID=UPI0018EED9FB|nr:VCBS repeat-containing protein [[Phormidium] sp. ETS-05]
MNDDSANVSLLLGNGSGSFNPTLPLPWEAFPNSITPGDFNGDGNLDLAVVNDDNVSLLLGNGSGSFNPHTTFAVGDYLTRVTSGDFNGDGNLT